MTIYVFLSGDYVFGCTTALSHGTAILLKNLREQIPKATSITRSVRLYHVNTPAYFPINWSMMGPTSPEMLFGANIFLNLAQTK